MREIKFRAWDKNESEMRAIQPNWSMSVLSDDEHYSIMQFTGLKDKNGKEIYEGDILETGTGHKLTVEWGEADGAWLLNGLETMIVKLPDGAFFPHYKWSAVIGNIYENPELKGTQ